MLVRNGPDSLWREGASAESKLKQIVSVLEITETAMRPVPKTSYLIPMCRKFRDKNAGLTLGHLKEHRGNGMFSEIKLIAENKKY